MSPGYDPVETTLDLSARHPVDLPLIQLVRSRGGLEIQSEPPDAEYTLQSEDGKVSRTGRLPANISELPTGNYSLVAKRGDWEISDTVEIKRAEMTKNRSSLRPLQSM